MDTSEYLGMFLAESREHLQTLNLAVIRIEEAPDDGDTIDEIFRIAHSLKGMSGTMGFARMAALTHTMEDVFETLRGRTGALERRVIDVLLECLDALEGAVEAIERDGDEQLDPSALIARLSELVGAAPLAAAEAPADEAAETPEAVAAYSADIPLLHVSVKLADDVMMPSVRAFMALAAVADHGETIWSSPTPDEVDAFSGSAVDAWVATDHEAETIEAAIRAVPDVADVTVAVHAGSAEPAASVDEPAAEAAADAAVPPPAAGAREPAAEPAAQAGAAPQARKTSATVRVDALRLDQLMHFMGELVVHRTRVESLAAGASVEGLAEAVGDLTRSSQALQALVMQVRMIEVDAVFMRFPRLVRDLSAKMGKQVDLVLTGRDTELDRTVVDALGDPLVHLVRNSLDHALETPAEREAAGKPATGVLELSARQAGGNVIITVRDDGRGIDPARVARKALERGLIAPDEAASVDMPRAIELLFAAGFSTADQTSDISGRGVGMDAVRSTLRGLGGNVVMTSEPGVGTIVQVRLPLTLAIMPALLVESQTVPFAIPLERVERTVNLADQTVRSVTGQRMLVLSDGVLPLIDLAEALGYEPAPEAAFVVIARGAEQRMALVVEQLVGQHELVTRPLPAEAGSQSCLSGGAVLSDGTISLIVDCDALAETRAGHRPGAASGLQNAA
ncbi:MAG TPA: chemotaxis protein CheA [Gaiellales bacterium]|jgi:two-component system chemotaxis sensor kinase CheA